MELKPTNYPWDENLFKIDEKSPLLNKTEAETLHTFTMKGLFVAKRGRQDLAPVISFLTTRVNNPTKQDWNKLIKMMRFLVKTQDDVSRIQVDKLNSAQWYVDAAFAVHNDMKSHTGAIFTMGKGAIQSISTKQKINTRSSTEAELVSIDDMIAKAEWYRLFLRAQGYGVNESLIYRDNQASMKLENNGKSSSSSRTRHFNIKYFYITDLIKRGSMKTRYCSTDNMIADYMTKPLMGRKFHQFRQSIMNLPNNINNGTKKLTKQKLSKQHDDGQ